MSHLPVPLMSRAFFRGYALMYLPKSPEWATWCGEGPLDNEACAHLAPDASGSRGRRPGKRVESSQKSPG